MVTGERAEAKDVVGEGLGLERRKRGLEKEEELGKEKGLGLGSPEGQLGNCQLGRVASPLIHCSRHTQLIGRASIDKHFAPRLFIGKPFIDKLYIGKLFIGKLFIGKLFTFRQLTDKQAAGTQFTVA
jgi:hypothetical protein